jgi:hypothetical protein
LVATGANTGEQPVGALGLFGGFSHHAAHEKELRIVASMLFAIDRLHVKASAVGDLISRRFDARRQPATSSVGVTRQPVALHGNALRHTNATSVLLSNF